MIFSLVFFIYDAVYLSMDGRTWPIVKSANQAVLKRSWSTKVYKNGATRLELSDAGGRPVLSIPISASLAPKCIDAGIAYFIVDAEGTLHILGGLLELLSSFPDEFEIILSLDKGFM